MKLLLLTALLSFSVLASAQQRTSHHFSLDWYSGKVVFTHGDTLKCLLRYNQTGLHPILQINTAGRVLALPVRDVSQFSFADSRLGRERLFAAFHDAEKNNAFFMEKLYDDTRFAILNYKTMEVPDKLNFSRFVGKPMKTFKKFILDEATGELLPLSRENALSLLNDRSEEVLGYVKARGIRFKKVSDFIEVFSYHSSL